MRAKCPRPTLPPLVLLLLGASWLLDGSTAAMAAEMPVIGFSAEATEIFFVRENQGTATVVVLRDGPTNETSTVRYQLRDANKGWVTLTPGQLVFGPGERRQEIHLTVVDNPDDDSFDRHTLGLTLFGVEGAVLGERGLPDPAASELETRIWIRDNEFPWSQEPFAPRVGFRSRTPAAAFGEAFARFQLRRFGDSGGALTVFLSTADRTALAGVHYVAQTSVPVTFAALETEKTVSLPLIGGTISGREISLQVTLTGEESGQSWTNSALLRLVNSNRAGAVDLSFDAGDLQTSSGLAQDGASVVIEDMAPLPDGRVYVGGHLAVVQGILCDAIARLMPDGTLDPSFGGHSGAFSLNGDTHRLFLDADGKLIAGYYGTRRFRPDGSGERTLLGGGRVLAMLPNGGWLTETPMSRLNADGLRDPGFQSPTTYAGGPVLVDPDGSIVLPEMSGDMPTSRLIRLRPDGTVDPTFAPFSADARPGWGPGFVEAMARQPDGRYLVQVTAEQIDIGARFSLVRLNHDGRLDPSFAPDPELFLFQDQTMTPFEGDQIFDLAVQPDGRILVAGRFRQPRSKSHGGLIRLNPDGSLDSSFDVGEGAGDFAFVKRIVLQVGGQILASGSFNDFDGFPRANLVRIHARDPVLRLGRAEIGAEADRLAIPVETAGNPLDSIEIQSAPSLSSPAWKKAELIRIIDADPRRPRFVVRRDAGASQEFFRAVRH